jgi:hypothetical protein
MINKRLLRIIKKILINKSNIIKISNFKNKLILINQLLYKIIHNMFSLKILLINLILNKKKDYHLNKVITRLYHLDKNINKFVNQKSKNN